MWIYVINPNQFISNSLNHVYQKYQTFLNNFRRLKYWKIIFEIISMYKLFSLQYFKIQFKMIILLHYKESNHFNTIKFISFLCSKSYFFHFLYMCLLYYKKCNEKYFLILFFLYEAHCNLLHFIKLDFYLKKNILFPIYET